MRTAAFVFKFVITLVAIVAAFFVAVALIGVFKGISTAEVLQAIGCKPSATPASSRASGGRIRASQRRSEV